MLYKTLIFIPASLLLIIWILLPTNAEVFLDDFDGRLDRQIWHFDNSGDAQSTFKVEGGMLKIHANGLHEMKANLDEGLKLLLHRVSPDVDWSIDLCMQFDEKPFWQWSGLIVYDPTNKPSTDWLALVYGHTLTKLSLQWLENNQLHEWSTPFVPGNSTCLRIVRNGEVYSIFTKAFDAADEAWINPGQLNVPAKINIPNPSKLGIVVRTFLNHVSSETLFDSFRISGDEIILENMKPVKPQEKLAASWGRLKSDY